MKLDDLNLFRLVVEHGNYTATSRKTGIPVATITRRIQSLEDDLNLRLLNRNARRLSLTETGERFYKACSPLLRDLTQVSQDVSDDCRGASGKVRICAPSNTARYIMMPILNQFMQAYPDIQLDLSITTNTEELDTAEWDVLFCVGPQKDSNLIVRKINQINYLLVASPQYLANAPQLTTAHDLHQHALLKAHPLMKWQLHNQMNEHVVIDDSARLNTNEFHIVREACCNHLGISLLPDLIVKNDLVQGQLVQVLPEWQVEPREVYMMYNYKDHLPDKVRLLIDYIVNHKDLSDHNSSSNSKLTTTRHESFYAYPS